MDTIELIANQIYDKLTILFNKNRKKNGIQNGTPIIVPGPAKVPPTPPPPVGILETVFF